MTDQGNFDIRHVRSIDIGTENKCPVCGDSFTANYLAVCDSRGEPLCDLCAWEKDVSLAGLLYLSDVAGGYCQAEPPPHILGGLDQRRADPERLKRKLKEAYESLHDNGRGPLAELVAGQVKAALDSGTVETMIKAKALVEETRNRVPNLDDEIPF